MTAPIIPAVSARAPGFFTGGLNICRGYGDIKRMKTHFNGEKAMQNIWRLLKSKTLALYLIGLMTVTMVTGVVTAGKKSADFFAGRWFLIITGVFLINILACTLDMAGKTIKAGRLEKMSRYFMAARWGTVIFHLGLIIIVLSGSLAFATKMDGLIAVPEGQSFYDAHENYVELTEGPWYDEVHGKFQIYLHNVRVTSYNAQNVPDAYASKISFVEEGRLTRPMDTKTGRPAVYRGFTFFQYKHGYIPVLRQKTTGTSPFTYKVILDAYMHGSSEEHRGEFTLPQTGFRVAARFYPDVAGPGERPVAASYRLKNPGLFLIISRDKEVIYRGTLKKGGTVNFSGVALTFQDLSRWSGFRVVEDRGRLWLYIGFWVCVAGLGTVYLTRGFWRKPQKEAMDDD